MGQPGGQVPKPTDSIITQNVLDVLAASGRVNVANVSVSCVNGVVALDGVVVTPAERDMVERTARSVAGVSDVVNRLVVVQEAEKTMGRGPDGKISPSGPSEP